MQRGITRTELVIALAILLITALWVMPVLMSNPPGFVQKTQCLSNTKQLCMAMLMYCSDHNERYPTGGRSPGTSWGPALAIYLKQESVFHCPPDRTLIATPGPDRVYSYAYNDNIASRSRSNHPAMEEPDKTVMLFEVTNAAGYRTPQGPDVIESPAGNGGTAFPIAIPASTADHHPYYATGNIGGRHLSVGMDCVPRHEGKSNYGAADGHAIACLPEEVSGGYDAVDSRCGQGTAPPHPAPCEKQLPGNAAGTGAKRFKLTFSTI